MKQQGFSIAVNLIGREAEAAVAAQSFATAFALAAVAIRRFLAAASRFKLKRTRVNPPQRGLHFMQPVGLVFEIAISRSVACWTRSSLIVAGINSQSFTIANCVF